MILQSQKLVYIMFRFISLLALIFNVVAHPFLELQLQKNWKNERIVGGSNAQKGQIPYQVSLRDETSYLHFCGGSIISKDWILSAAICTIGKSPSQVSFNTGSIFIWYPTGESYRVSRIINHEQYDSQSHVNDISLLQSAEEILLGGFVQTIGLQSNPIGGGQLATMAGWGLLSDPGYVPNQLQIIQLRTLTNNDCTQRLEGVTITNGHVCTFTRDGEGICMGDSGGALVVNGIQEGIASMIIECGKGYPDVFTRISYYRDWIKNHSGV